MFETVTTNVAGILTIIVLWSSATGVLVYLYTKTKDDKVIKFLDDYIFDMHKDYDAAIQRLTYIEREYGHVIDDYIEMYSDGQWKLEKLEADR